MLATSDLLKAIVLTSSFTTPFSLFKVDISGVLYNQYFSHIT